MRRTVMPTARIAIAAAALAEEPGRAPSRPRASLDLPEDAVFRVGVEIIPSPMYRAAPGVGASLEPGS